MPWLSRPPAATRSRRCAGRARARRGLRGNWSSRAIRSARAVSVTFWRTLATVSKRPARPGKVASMRTGTPNSPVSLARRRSTRRLAIQVISLDAKKKELVGDFKNGGQEWQPKGEPEDVRVYAFLDPDLGKVAPYGVYDVTANQGWVSVGIDHDTGRIRRRKHP